jgi:hypothetical protein
MPNEPHLLSSFSTFTYTMHFLSRRSFSIYLIVALVYATACTDTPLDSAAIRQGMAARKVYRITEVQITSAAERVGKRTARVTDSLLTALSIAQSKRLTIKVGTSGDSSINSESNKASTSSVSCTDLLVPVRDSLAKAEITFRRLRYDAWPPIPKGTPDKLKAILEAARYTHTAGGKMPANLQKDGKGGYQYVSPMLVTSQTCIRCHAGWNQGQEIGVWDFRFTSRPAVYEASKGMKGM